MTPKNITNVEQYKLNENKHQKLFAAFYHREFAMMNLCDLTE